jgi:hypothetical protein
LRIGKPDADSIARTPDRERQIVSIAMMAIPSAPGNLRRSPNIVFNLMDNLGYGEVGGARA